MVKQSLSIQQKLLQTQRLSPVQIQTVKLIQVPTVELLPRVQKELEENPILEEDDSTEPEEAPKNVSISEYTDDTPSYRLYVNNQGKDLKPQYNTFQVKEGFRQSLERQLGFCQLSDRSRRIALFIIGMIDDDGYLRRASDMLSYDVSVKAGIETTEEEVEQIVELIQTFEPAGIGARDLRECLLLQLQSSAHTPAQQLAETILQDYFEPFAKKHYDRIISRLDITEEQLKEAIAEIRHLNPSPGGQIDDSYSEQAQQVVPDFVIDLNGDQLEMTMPRYNVPELRINRRYADTLMNAAKSATREGKEAEAFVKQKLDSAKWFIEALKQRQNTLRNTMNAIIDFQHDYFMDGDETKLKPMVLKNIAEKTGYDISTISRVVNSKYVQTHFGVFSLKYFFSEGLTNTEGEEVSTREVKNILSQSIGEEDKRKPLTDEHLVEVLKEKGYNVARRTVAKYREQLGIPVARLRKEI